MKDIHGNTIKEGDRVSFFLECERDVAYHCAKENEHLYRFGLIHFITKDIQDNWIAYISIGEYDRDPNNTRVLIRKSHQFELDPIVNAPIEIKRKIVLHQNCSKCNKITGYISFSPRLCSDCQIGKPKIKTLSDKEAQVIKNEIDNVFSKLLKKTNAKNS
jgi:hypothetical protein